MAVGGSITGDKAIDRRLANLSTRGSQRAITAGILAGMTPIAKAMRAAINATSASSELKREGRKAVGKRFKKAKGGAKKGTREAKVGFGVGKKRKKAADRAGGGVGISAANIQWPVLGTEERATKAGGSTGRMPAVFEGVTESAFAASKEASMAAARAKISQVIMREAKKQA